MVEWNWIYETSRNVFSVECLTSTICNKSFIIYASQLYNNLPKISDVILFINHLLIKLICFYKYLMYLFKNVLKFNNIMIIIINKLYEMYLHPIELTYKYIIT